MALIGLDTDELFFKEHPSRRTRIRLPVRGEQDAAFRSLGDHAVDRRRMLIMKVPMDSTLSPGSILRLPMLLFSDESVADNDEILLPIINELMGNAARQYGITPLSPRRI
jgi:hypothetical protein